MIGENITRSDGFHSSGFFSPERDGSPSLSSHILVVYSLLWWETLAWFSLAVWILTFTHPCTFLSNSECRKHWPISLTQLDPRHTPTYLFLSSLAFVDFCYSSSVAPESLETLLTKHRSIPLCACVHSWAFPELLGFGDIPSCSNGSWPIRGHLQSSSPHSDHVPKGVHATGSEPPLTQHCPFSTGVCPVDLLWPHVINHFYCDEVPLMALACSDTSLKEILILSLLDSTWSALWPQSLFLTYTLWLPSLRIQSAEEAPSILILRFPSDCCHSAQQDSDLHVSGPSQTIPLTQTKWPLSPTQ